MTLEEAIQRYSEIEKKHRQFSFKYARVYAWDTTKTFQSSAEEHKQLVKWLTELKQRKENHSHWIDRDGMMICEKCGAEFSVNMPFCGMCGAEMG